MLFKEGRVEATGEFDSPHWTLSLCGLYVVYCISL